MFDPRLQEIAERAQAATRPSDFHELARRGRRRRVGRVLAAGAATALVLGGTTLGVHSAYDDSSTPVHPVGPITSPTLTTPSGSPETTSCRATLGYTTYDCDLIALLRSIGVTHPEGQLDGYRGATWGGPYKGRYLQVFTNEVPTSLPQGRHLGFVVIGGTMVELLLDDLRGEVAEFRMDGLTYWVSSQSAPPDSGTSTRSSALKATRALLAALHARSGQELTAEQIVQEPDAALTSVAIASDDANTRASSWRLCLGKSCRHQLYALAVTDDAFAHAHYVGLTVPSDVTWAGGQDFVVETSSAGLQLVDSGGNVRPLQVTEAPSPLRAGETLASVSGSSYGVDATRLIAHRISSPPDLGRCTPWPCKDRPYGASPDSRT